MPANDPVTERILRAIANVKRLPQESLSAEQSLAELGFDSLDTISLLFELEEEFKITIPDEEARKIRNISDIVTGIHMLTAQPASGSSSEPAA